ncbi:hypothetical protein COU75_03920 [Candidatus Peregrinibacteria bacterium CG10_big_fil_rev_8_21_14_0_10_42_8]|nr:MAG: hypothetical protein COU75_03920 [Candidatus Peregrinibacteria bacterium CG10_big_fil_rev_8_21_14_0_10_42_8]
MNSLSFIKTGVLTIALATGLSSAHGVSAAGGSLTLEQKSPNATLGQWIITKPDGTEYKTSLKTKILNDLTAGTYRVAVRAPEKAVTKLSLTRGVSVLQESPSTIMTFDINDGESLHLKATYTYTGTVKVQSNPSGVPFIMSDMNGGKFSGTTPAVFHDMDPVMYRVHYDVTRDCEVRKSQERVLIEGSSLIFYSNFNCGDRPISLAGKTTEPTASGKIPTPKAPEPAHSDMPDARILQTSNLSEVIPGGNIRFTVAIRNLTRGTLHNIDVTDRFNPSSVEIFSLMDGGIIDGQNIQWNVPELFAGQVWTTTFEARAKDHLKAGDRIVLLAHAVSDEADAALYPEAWSSVVGVGIAYMPQTGFRYDLLIALAALVGAALMTISTNRVKQSKV